jgi:light-regulated signal transduction histidine kinase (bacteriophytochrome)
MIIPAGDLLNDEHVTSSGEADEMAYIISHDLRAPLRAVAGYGHILQKDFTAALGPEGAVILTRIVAETERMNGMLTALATLSRTAAQPLARREMDLGKECEAAWSDAGGGDGLQVCSSVEVNADPSLLRMLFKELLSNSLKSRAAGRPLNVSFHATEIEGGWAGAVVDNGIGFNMRSAAKLFAPFQKMHSAAEFPGHGVGLAVAAKIAHRHGGKIWIVSVEGAGTAVFFTLRRP